MQVLGDLIVLPPNLAALPLPWWHRAPLGLLHNTSVNIAMLHSDRRPLGDLIISVLNMEKWENILRLECRRPDEPGVIAHLLDAVYPLNVDLAESATIESGKVHTATLICELRDVGQVTQFIPGISDKLKAHGFEVSSLEAFSRLPSNAVWHGRAQVRKGWLDLKKLDFQRWLAGANPPENLGQVDLGKAVVSADTEKRILRFVFPRKGARTIKIQHADKPGVLRGLTRTLANCRLNILSALLRRGGQGEMTAELVAVCEPGPGADPSNLEQELRKRIDQQPPDARARLTINHGRPASEVVYPPEPDRIRPGHHRPVYVSRRFTFTSAGETALDQLADFLTRHGFSPISGGRIGPGVVRQSDYVARIWNAEMAIVPLQTNCDAMPASFLLDVAHECGHVQAQGKPLLVLGDKGRHPEVRAWCRDQGISWAAFPFDLAAPDGSNGEADPEGTGDEDLACWLGQCLRFYLGR